MQLAKKSRRQDLAACGSGSDITETERTGSVARCRAAARALEDARPATAASVARWRHLRRFLRAARDGAPAAELDCLLASVHAEQSIRRLHVEVQRLSHALTHHRAPHAPHAFRVLVRALQSLEETIRESY